MDLDVHKLELERQRLKELIDENARNWQSVVDEMTRQARREGGALAGLPTRPTRHADQLDRWSLTILDAGEWVNVDQVLTDLRARIPTTAAASVPTVGVEAEELHAALTEPNRQADASNLLPNQT